MVIKRKKGNTLVELIAAAAIIIMGLQAVTFAFSTSSGMWKSDDAKLDTTIINESICDLIRYEGRVDIKKIYLNRASIGDTMGFYIYFNMVGTDGNDPETLEYQFDQEHKKGYNGTTFVYDTSKNFNFATCSSSNNKDNKKFGALITLKDDRNSSGVTQIPVYKVNITVWNMQNAGKGSSEASFYIGGRH